MQGSIVGVPQGRSTTHVPFQPPQPICLHHKQRCGWPDWYTQRHCQIGQGCRHHATAWTDDYASHWRCCFWVRTCTAALQGSLLCHPSNSVSMKQWYIMSKPSQCSHCSSTCMSVSVYVHCIEIQSMQCTDTDMHAGAITMTPQRLACTSSILPKPPTPPSPSHPPTTLLPSTLPPLPSDTTFCSSLCLQGGPKCAAGRLQN